MRTWTQTGRQTRKTTGALTAVLMVALMAWIPLPSAAEDACEDISLWEYQGNDDYAEENAEAIADCAASSWDEESAVGCTPVLVGYDELSDQNPFCGGTHFADGSSAKCGYGWAQSWAVTVEITEGPDWAEAAGWIKCGDRDPDETGVGAECTVRTTEVSCQASGGSKRDPIDCDGEIIAGTTGTKAVVKCEDPANPHIVIEKIITPTIEDAPLP